MHAARAHVDAMAAVLSSGHPTAHLHPRPHDKNKKRMRIKGGPVAEIHKEAGRALVHDMATTLPVLTQSRNELLAGLRVSLRACASGGFQAGAQARGRLLRLEAAELKLATLPVFRPRPAYVVPSGQARDLISLLKGDVGARRPMVATPRARPFPPNQFVDAPGESLTLTPNPDPDPDPKPTSSDPPDRHDGPF
jgi:hypothetical protein